MSISLMSLVFYIDPEKCDTHEKAVLLALADHANDEGKSAYPSNRRLAWKCSMTERGIEKVIDRLEQKRLAQMVHQGGGRATNEYELDIDEIAKISVDPRTEFAPAPNRVRLTPEPHSDDPSLTTRETAVPLNEDVSIGMSLSDSLPERIAKAMKQDCPFCGAKSTIQWQHTETPCCNAPIVWDGNKWLKKQLAKQVEIKHRGQLSDACQIVYDDAAQHNYGNFRFKIKPDQALAIDAFSRQYGVTALQDLVTSTRELDNEKPPAGFIEHICNRIKKGVGTQSKSKDIERGTYELT